MTQGPRGATLWECSAPPTPISPVPQLRTPQPLLCSSLYLRVLVERPVQGQKLKSPLHVDAGRS